MTAYIASRLLGGSLNGIGKAFSGIAGLGKKAMTGVADMFSKKAAAAASPGAGGGMMESFSKINTTSLIKGAAAMAIAAAGIFIFAKAIQELEKVKDWGNVAMGLGAFAVSMGLIGAVGQFASAGLEALAVGLNAFGAAMMTGYGAVGLIALAAGAIALGAALNLAAPGIQAFGTVVATVFAGLATLVGAVADGFVTMLGAVTMENIGPMLLLGPALFGIAAGLAAIAIAGPMAIPSLLAVTGLAAVAGGVATIFGAGESKSAGEARGKSEEGSLAAVEKKLDALIAAVKAGGNVYMDSNKVGRAQVLGSYKSA